MSKEYKKYKFVEHSLDGSSLIEELLKRNEPMKPDYDTVMNDTATNVYLFHGTNAKMLDDFLVSGTFFTTDLTIAMKYGKTIYAFELNNRSFKYFELDREGYFISLGHIPLSHCIRLGVMRNYELSL